MPRVTRSQVKQLVKPKPYCKENRPSKRRTALLDVVENNRNVSNSITFISDIIFNIYCTMLEKLIFMHRVKRI